MNTVPAASLRLQIIERGGKVGLLLVVNGEPLALIGAGEASAFLARVEWAVRECEKAQRDLDAGEPPAA